MQGAKILRFPDKRPLSGKKRRTKIQNIDGIKSFTESQVKLLRRTVRDKADLDLKKGKLTAVREWLVIDLLTSTGLRVSEAANVRCGDIKTGYGESGIFVRCGKGRRSRTVEIPNSLKTHLKAFLAWKEKRGEPTGPDDHLLIGQRGPMTAQAIEQIVKKYLKQLGLYEPGKSAHALRHSYAVHLYRKRRDLRAVQKQLGHASVQTTQIYADITREDLQEQVKNLWR